MASRNRIQTFRSTDKLARPEASDSPLAGELYVNYPDKQLGVVAADAIQTLDLLPVRFFSSTTDYSTNDLVAQAGSIYKANGSIASGNPFNPANWTAIGGSGGSGVTDGDKGDVIVSGTGATWLLDPAITAAIAAKEPALPAGGTTSNFLRGDKTWAAVPAAGARIDVADTAPSSPVDNQLWWQSSTGGFFIRFNDGSSTQWVQVNGASGIADAPADGGEYVRVNGVWRQKSRTLILDGLTTAEVTVPTGARMVKLTGAIYPTTATYAAPGWQASVDGTNYIAGASDYYHVGFTHATGSNAFVNAAGAASAVGYLTYGQDYTPLGIGFEMTLPLARPSTGESFVGMVRGTYYRTLAADAYQDNVIKSVLLSTNLGSNLTIKKLKFLWNAAQTFRAPSTIDCEWVY